MPKRPRSWTIRIGTIAFVLGLSAGGVLVLLDPKAFGDFKSSLSMVALFALGLFGNGLIIGFLPMLYLQLDSVLPD